MGDLRRRRAFPPRCPVSFQLSFSLSFHLLTTDPPNQWNRGYSPMKAALRLRGGLSYTGQPLYWLHEHYAQFYSFTVSRFPHNNSKILHLRLYKNNTYCEINLWFVDFEISSLKFWLSPYWIFRARIDHILDRFGYESGAKPKASY